ncbi:MAG: ferric reductase-like transmembrane domain-containing protein [Pseudomonadota bacterium]
MTAWISVATTSVAGERTLKGLLHGLLALPLLLLVWDVYGEIAAPGSRLGADPGGAVVLYLGIWAIRLLLLSLAVSSLRRLSGNARLLRYRRMIGLWAFAYLLLHFLAYLGFLAVFDLAVIGEDIFERPYITVGFAALLLLVPLAVTSTNGWRRRLGRRWVQLHRASYLAMALGLLHFFWLTKDGFAEVALYGLLFAALMTERVLNGGLSRGVKAGWMRRASR